jgi:hypothetical protein
MRRTLTAVAAALVAAATALAVAPVTASADTGSPVVQFHPPRCC